MKDYFKKDEVNPIIDKLCRDINPITILLITKQGTVISEAGDTQSINTTAMAALTAGMFSATREVARMVGEQQFSILLQQGEKRHIHISLVTEDAMMVIVFEDYQRIGKVRVEAKKAGVKLIEIAVREKAKDTVRVTQEPLSAEAQSATVACSEEKQDAQKNLNQDEQDEQDKQGISEAEQNALQSQSAEHIENTDPKISTPEFKEFALNLIDQIFVTKS